MIKKLKIEMKRYLMCIKFVHVHEKNLILEFFIKSGLESILPFLSYFLTGLVIDNFQNIDNSNLKSILYLTLKF